ncbi:hypothetical protein [Streptomyces sp. NPDC088261]|uniref:hypothetical protein n=1 Tax=Streptomyces sp. NPDC088261 TaxID=3365851 RepID=UPI0037FAD859
MRQLSAPGRLVVGLVTSLAVASSTGCMSVGADAGKPAPSRSAGRHGAAVAPDGGTGEAPGGSGGEPGRTEPGGGDRVHADREGTAKEVSPTPSSSHRPASPAPSKGVPPQPGKPTPPPWNEPQPTKEPTRPAPPPSDPPPPPPPSPEPQPEPDPEPTVLPSASPAANLRAVELFPGDGTGMRKMPTASPQVGPV